MSLKNFLFIVAVPDVFKKYLESALTNSSNSSTQLNIVEVDHHFTEHLAEQQRQLHHPARGRDDLCNSNKVFSHLNF